MKGGSWCLQHFACEDSLGLYFLMADSKDSSTKEIHNSPRLLTAAHVFSSLSRFCEHHTVL